MLNCVYILTEVVLHGLSVYVISAFNVNIMVSLHVLSNQVVELISN